MARDAHHGYSPYLDPDQDARISAILRSGYWIGMSSPFLDEVVRSLALAIARPPNCSSSLASTTSITAFLLKRQYMVWVLSKLPFSNSLLAGAPPRHTSKYSQSRRHFWMPR